MARLINEKQVRVLTAKGREETVDLDDYEDNYHPAHPDDELPPRKPFTKAKLIAKLQENR